MEASQHRMAKAPHTCVIQPVNVRLIPTRSTRKYYWTCAYLNAQRLPYPLSTFLLITSFWISLVPSPMVQSLLSR